MSVFYSGAFDIFITIIISSIYNFCSSTVIISIALLRKTVLPQIFFFKFINILKRSCLYFFENDFPRLTCYFISYLLKLVSISYLLFYF